MVENLDCKNFLLKSGSLGVSLFLKSILNLVKREIWTLKGETGTSFGSVVKDN